MRTGLSHRSGSKGKKATKRRMIETHLENEMHNDAYEANGKNQDGGNDRKESIRPHERQALCESCDDTDGLYCGETHVRILRGHGIPRWRRWPCPVRP